VSTFRVAVHRNINLINNLIYEPSDELTIEKFTKEYNEKDINWHVLIPLQNMLVLYSVSSYEEKSILDFMCFDKNNNFQFKNSIENRYYRGE